MSWSRDLLFLTFVLSVTSGDYQLPDIGLEPSSDGYYIYIPDDVNHIKSVKYMLEVNKKCPLHKNYLMEPNNGNWTLKETVHSGDNVKVYLFVEVDNATLKKYAELHVSDNGEGNLVKSAETPKLCESNEWCLPTETTFLGIKSKCAGDLLFEETFSTLNMSVWTHEIRSMVHSHVSEFVAYDNQPENCYIDEGKLVLKATWNHANKAVNLTGRCTSRKDKISANLHQECEYNCSMPGHRNYGHPAAFSSKIHTRGKVYGKYFRMEIRARLARGNFLFPYVLLQPMSKYSEDLLVNYIRIGARGNKQLESIYGKQMDGRILLGEILQWISSVTPVHFDRPVRAEQMYSSRYHVYGINWQRNRITFAVDGKDFGWIDTKSLKSFNEEDFYVVLGLTAGGVHNFPGIKGDFSEIMGKHGRQVNEFRRTNVSSTWKQPLKVDYIRLFATELIQNDDKSQ